MAASSSKSAKKAQVVSLTLTEEVPVGDQLLFVETSSRKRIKIDKSKYPLLII
jgi:hypothetical protein